MKDDALVDHLFRHHSGRLVATLARVFGSHRLDLAEEVVQDALVKAMELWPFQGVPDEPVAWLMQVAKRRALDVVRREASLRAKEAEVVRAFSAQAQGNGAAAIPDDDTLGLIFLACHPALSAESRVALTLKTVAGFSVAEIARAFLKPEPAIAQRIVRAKRQIREEDLRFEMPDAAALPERLDSVLAVLYLVFNEGHTAHAGDRVLRWDVAAEAIRLTRLLAGHKATRCGETHALLALMLLTAARFPSRTSTGGDLFLLREQDRSKWDQSMIAEGLAHLDQSRSSWELTTYHLQAGIAAAHATAPGYEATDWQEIRRCYDLLLWVDNSPVVALNRAVAVARVEGPRAGLALVEAIELERYYLRHAVEAELAREAGLCEQALAAYRAALDCMMSDPERRFLAGRLGTLRVS